MGNRPVAGSDSAAYGLHGMVVASPEPIGGSQSTRAPDWVVRRGDPIEVEGPPPGDLIGELSIGGFDYWSATQGDRGQRWVVHHRGTARTELDREERTVTICSDPRSDPRISSLLLAGSGMAHALAADGHSTLHASAVERGGRAIAFIGPSGKGKTTLAALLCASAASAVTDDVLRCEIEGDMAICFRGGTRFRLRPQAAALAGELAPPESTADGRTSVLAEPSLLERMPLAALIVPAPCRDVTELALRRLRGREAAAELLRSPRLLGWIDPGLATRHLRLCEGLAERVPVLEATIPWGPPFADGLAEELIDRVLSSS